MAEPVGIFPITRILRPPRGLDIGSTPVLWPQCPQHSRRVQGAGADFHVIGLQDRAALIGPIGLKCQDEVLKGFRFGVRFGCGHGADPNIDWVSGYSRAQGEASTGMRSE